MLQQADRGRGSIDARSALEAQAASTSWRSIQRGGGWLARDTQMVDLDDCGLNLSVTTILQ